MATLNASELTQTMEQREYLRAELVRAGDGRALVNIGGNLAVAGPVTSGQHIFPDYFFVRITHVSRHRGVHRCATHRNFCSRVSAPTLRSGDVIEGHVVEKVNKGIIVDIISGLAFIPYHQTTWRKYAPAEDAPKDGEQVRVTVISDSSGGGAYRFSMRPSLTKPIDLLLDMYPNPQGERFLADIVEVRQYGAFAELQSGFGAVGLIHVSDLFNDEFRHKSKKGDIVNRYMPKYIQEFVAGLRNVPVQINDLDPKTGRISLGCVDFSLDEPSRLYSTVNRQPVVLRVRDIHAERLYCEHLVLGTVIIMEDLTGLRDVRLGQEVPAMISGYDAHARAFLSRSVAQPVPKARQLGAPRPTGDVLVEFLAGESALSFGSSLSIDERWDELFQHIRLLSGAGVGTLVDYIYHYGCLGESRLLVGYALLEKARFQFELGLPGLGLSFLHAGLSAAVESGSKLLFEKALEISVLFHDVIWDRELAR